MRCNPIRVLHALCYGATVTYLRVLKLLVRQDWHSLRTRLVETYHAKVIPLGTARTFITVNRSIDRRNLETVLPFRHTRDLILINPHNIVVYDCPCRATSTNPCRPTDVCLIIGEPFADLLRMVQPFRSRRISADEALRILAEEDARGHVHTAWFKTAMLDRFYAICNCCSCCCLGMKFMAEYRMKMILPSGYRAVVGHGCSGCGKCVGYCQFGALGIAAAEEGTGTPPRHCSVDADACYGCGVCESKCPFGCIALIRDPAKGVPLECLSLQDPAGTDGSDMLQTI